MTMTPELKEFTAREFQTVAQVARFTQISKGKVYDAINAGELAARLFGTAKRVRTADALKWAGVPFPEGEQDAEQQNAEGQK